MLLPAVPVTLQHCCQLPAGTSMLCFGQAPSRLVSAPSFGPLLLQTSRNIPSPLLASVVPVPLQYFCQLLCRRSALAAWKVQQHSCPSWAPPASVTDRLCLRLPCRRLAIASTNSHCCQAVVGEPCLYMQVILCNRQGCKQLASDLLRVHVLSSKFRSS